MPLKANHNEGFKLADQGEYPPTNVNPARSAVILKYFGVQPAV